MPRKPPFPRADRALAGAVAGLLALFAGPAAAGGDGYLLRRDNSSQLCDDCHGGSLVTHSSAATGTKFGVWYVGCRRCHTPHGTTNAKLVATEITPPAVNGQWPPARTAFARRTGFDPAGGATSAATIAAATYANGDATGPCQVCHTRTAQWRRDGAADAIHLGSCGFCHRHGRGFRARCGDCHAEMPPTSGAHAAHLGASSPAPPFPGDTRPLGCGNCHPVTPSSHGDGARQVVLHPGLVLPGGTSTAGASLVGPVSSPSCVTACHFPLGAPAPPQPVAWSTVGPLPCRSCHSRIDPAASTSLHDPIFAEARPPSGEPTTCSSCHADGAHAAVHLTGDPGLAATTAVNATCVACHTPPSGPLAGPQGQVLHRAGDAVTSRTPVPLPGWSPVPVTTTVGDFHGGRIGAGSGGTLRAPYYRGYPAMACSACHAGHASANPFLFAAEVNGTTVRAGITRSGVGGERLCKACHEGEHHGSCLVCHAGDPQPAGRPCFMCHGHEGVRRFSSPYFDGPHDEPAGSRDCSHCHSGGWAPVADSAPPIFVPLDATPRVSALAATSARITWSTNEVATTWVEYGVGTPGYVAGNDAEVASHAVTLTGLAPSTTYVWRVRSVDASRNVLRGPLSTFTTWSATAVPAPDVAPVYAGGASTVTARLLWYPVTAPSGTPVEYEVQLASDAAFTYLQNSTLGIADPTLLTGNSGWVPGIPSDGGTLGFDATLTNLPPDDCGPVQPVNTYYFRVRARDAHGTVSEWSPTGVFGAGIGDPLC